MELKQLEYYCAVAKANSISKAAEEMWVSQSTISKSIIKLENELGIELLKRDKNTISFTEKGREVLRLAKRILDDVSRLGRIGVSDYKPGNTIRILSSDSVTLEMFRGYVTKSANKCLFETRVADDGQIEESLKNGSCDFAFTFLRFIKDPRMVNVPVFTDNIVIAIPKSHSFFNRSQIKLAELNGENLVCVVGSALSVDRVERFFRNKRVDVTLHFQSDFETCLRQIGVSPYPTIIPGAFSGLIDHSMANIVRIEDEDFQITNYLVYMRDSQAHLSKLIENVKKYYSDLSVEEYVMTTR